jgi:hypothetical protein
MRVAWALIGFAFPHLFNQPANPFPGCWPQPCNTLFRDLAFAFHNCIFYHFPDLAPVKIPAQALPEAHAVTACLVRRDFAFVFCYFFVIFFACQDQPIAFMATVTLSRHNPSSGKDFAELVNVGAY